LRKNIRLISGITAGVIAALVIGCLTGFFISQAKSPDLAAVKQTAYNSGYNGGTRDKQQTNQTAYSNGYNKGTKDDQQAVFGSFSAPFLPGNVYLVLIEQNSSGLFIKSRTTDPVPVGKCIVPHSDSTADLVSIPGSAYCP